MVDCWKRDAERKGSLQKWKEIGSSSGGGDDGGDGGESINI